MERSRAVSTEVPREPKQGGSGARAGGRVAESLGAKRTFLPVPW